MKQNEITKKDHLHDDAGHLKYAGYSKKQVVHYDRQKLKVPSFMVKEWDYYAVLNESFGMAITIADNGYLGFISATFFDFIKKEELTKTIMTVMPLGKFTMPSSSDEGDVVFKSKKASILFKREAGKRILHFEYPDFVNKKALQGKIELKQDDDLESIVVATPFAKKKRFYYNQKINCMKAKGKITFGMESYDFTQHESYGVLDWGRGVWTYENTWYWGSASGKIGDKLFGLNMGYGFGDTSKASENAIFYDGKTHKTSQVTFNIPADDYLKDWTIESDDNRIELKFKPILDRSSKTNILFLGSDQHQVFGHFNGHVVLDDGKKIKVDNLLGFAEKVYNKW